MRNLGQEDIKRSRTEITFCTDTADGHINSCGDRRVHPCGCALVDCIKRCLERCDDVPMEVDLAKVFTSHHVMLEGEAGLMATLHFFKPSHKGEGLRPFFVASVHDG